MHEEAQAVLDWAAENTGTDAVDARLAEGATGTIATAKALELSRQLYSLLVDVTDGESFDLVVSSPHNGFEA